MESLSFRNPTRPTRRALLGAGAALAAVATLPMAPALAADDSALIKAAQAEGTITFYSSATLNIVRRVTDAFKSKYGISASFSRFGSTPLLQRYATEAEAGNIAADLFFVAGGANQFAEIAGPKGWTVPVADLPVVTSGEFPKENLDKSGPALVQISPWAIAYNTDKLKGADVPKDWSDLFHPRYKGQILVADLHSTEADIQFFQAIREKYSDAYFEKLKAMDLRLYVSQVPALQALAAGEGLVVLPATPSAALDIAAKGAPLDFVIPDFTTGVEMELCLTNPAKAKHPNAARLFANYVMSKEGNTLFNQDRGSVGVYDIANRPKQYVKPMNDIGPVKDAIFKLMDQKP